MMKIAFDVHGVLDTYKEYRILMRDLYHDRHTIYIISGQPLDDDMQKFLKEYHLDKSYHHYHSVETYLLDSGVEYTEDSDGEKHFADEYWNHIKAIICEDENIDMIFDDSPQYAEAFKSVRTVFSLVIDKTKTLMEKK